MLEQFKLLLPAITRLLCDHHRLYPIIKVRDYLWEQILFSACREALPDYGAIWDYGSQKIGRDISLNNRTEISCKSGQIHRATRKKPERIKISSSRLSRLSDVEKIKEYLRGAKTEDYHLCLSTKKCKTPMFDGDPEYLFSVYRHDVFDYPNMTWESFGKDANLRGYHQSGVEVTCTKAMGWQIWFYLPTRLALFSIPITRLVKPSFEPLITMIPFEASLAGTGCQGNMLPCARRW